MAATMLAATLAGTAAAAQAQEGRAQRPARQAPPVACPPRAPVVQVQVVDPEPLLSAEAGVDALHAMTGRPRMPAARHLGLTVSRIEWRTEITLRTLRLPAPPPGGGQVFCAVPATVTLTLAHAEHRIRIARELTEGGCLFAQVEAHERRHVAVNRETLRAAARTVRTAAEAWARTAEGRGATLEEATDGMRQGLRRAIEPAMEAMRQAQARRHAAIDSPAEYRRLARVCPEDQAMLAERLRDAAR
jgi:hypothetical protein